MKVATRRLEDKYAKLSDEVSDMMVNVSRTITQRDAYKQELTRCQNKCSNLQVDKLQLQLKNDGLNHHIKVMQEDLDFYRSSYHRALLGSSFSSSQSTSAQDSLRSSLISREGDYSPSGRYKY